MKKRVLLFVFLLSFACLVFTGCNEHEHDFSKQIVADEYLASAATCTQKAKYYYTCDCGEVAATTFESGELASHTLSHHNAKDPTCTEGGWTAYDECSVCGYSTKVVLQPTGHTFNQCNTNEAYSKTAATCTSKAVYYKSCSCGVVGTDTFEFGNFAEHNLEHHNAKAATCTEVGWDEYDTCLNCSYTTYSEIPTIEHTFDQEVVSADYLKSAATCTSKAVYYKTCICGAVGTETFEDGEFAEHDLEHHNAKAATCTEVGWNEYDTCSNCSYTTYSEIAKKSHKYDQEVVAPEYLKTAATCSSKAVYYYSCVCGKKTSTSTKTFEAGEYLPHDLTHHNGQTATCTEVGWAEYDTCSKCSYTTYSEIPANGHAFNQEVDEQKYLKSAATCTAKAVCYKSCSCGAVGTETFTSGEFAEHSYVWITDVEATTTTDGSKHEECSVCHDVRNQNTVIPCGHSVHEYNVQTVNNQTKASNATCEQKATYYYSCSCGDISSTLTFESGDYGDHDYTDVITSDTYRVSDGVNKYYYCCSVCSASSKDTASEEIYESYYNGYYDGIVSWTDKDDLVSQLHDLISNDYALSFNDPNWETNQFADQSLYNYDYVDVLYSTTDYLKTRTNFDWQREHCFCASLMCGVNTSDAVKELGRSTDYHNLVAAWSSGNTSRGNKNFGTANSTDAKYTVVKDSNNVIQYSYDTNNFEPNDEDKGRVARAIFYMTIMYNEEATLSRQFKDNKGNVLFNIGDKQGALTVQENYVEYVAGSGCAFSIGNLSTLLDWNDMLVKDYVEDSVNGVRVSLQEYLHNESVYSHEYKGHAQGNRNPFVDYPDLISYIFDTDSDNYNQPGKITDLTSTYESLSLGSDDVMYYALKSDSNTYEVGSTFDMSKLTVVGVTGNFEEIACTNFTLTGITNGQSFNEAGTISYTINVTDTGNFYCKDIVVTKEVFSTDPIANSNFVFDIPSAASGKPFNDIKTNSGIVNNKTFNGVPFTITWDNGSIGAFSNTQGCKFGDGTTPTGSLIMESVNDFSYDSKSKIQTISLRGSAASGGTYSVKFKIDGVQVGDTYTVNYVSGGTCTVSYTLQEPTTGKLTIEITNPYTTGSNKKPFYVQTIAVNTVE